VDYDQIASYGILVLFEMVMMLVFVILQLQFNEEMIVLRMKDASTEINFTSLLGRKIMTVYFKWDLT